jgi:hypothetical protein
MSQPRSIRKRAASVRRQVHAYMRAVCSVYNNLSLENAKRCRLTQLFDKLTLLRALICAPYRNSILITST